jgi:hypothetical protein
MHKSKLEKISIDDKYSIFQRVNIQNGQIPASKLKGCPITNIPLLEINSTLSVTPPIDLLVVNCNPSGTDYNYYTSQTPCDVMVYSKIKGNPYLEWGKKLLPNKKVVMADICQIVCQNQEIIREAIKKHKVLFQEMYNIFWQLVCELSPKVIVVTNAYVRDIIVSQKFLSRPEWINITSDDANVRYILRCPEHDQEVVLLCGGMIAGAHQMDKDSRRRLERDIKAYIK